MHNQPRHEPHEPTAFFADGQSSRPIVAGTVARGQLVPNDLRFAGLAEGEPAEAFPFEITKADLLRGQQRFNIYCSMCHGVDGDGNGMVVQRGFTRPPSLHEQRLKDAPVGHFFDVITNGWGAMYSYNDRVFPEDRWRIIAYVRVLQLSQADAVASAQGRSTPDGAMQQPSATPSRPSRDGAMESTGGAAQVSGGATEPSGGATTSSGGTPKPSGSATEPSGGIPKPSGSTPEPSGDAPERSGSTPEPSADPPGAPGGATEPSGVQGTVDRLLEGSRDAQRRQQQQQDAEQPDQPPTGGPPQPGGQP